MRKVLFFFGIVNDQDIDWLVGAGSKETMHEGAVLVTQGQPVNVLAMILTGKFRIDVGERAIAECGSGEVIGELSFLDSRPPTASVTAMEDSIVLCIDRNRLQRKIDTDTGFASRFYRAVGVSLAHRLREATSQMGYGQQGQLTNLSEDDPNEIDPEFLDNISLAGQRFDEMLQKLLLD